ncbi:response regulator transcription factor [Caldisalinibacter kiritimatiensis]|uniref:Phosphate regulon transcriptional regulatory protein PhoB (SphR) n=1 Tax=Caldisalinibacter kiritimatiensis TaxID=1304284 RepID=R1CNC8_9FIRM|nr:response regulator transcription factor [Caldisalinibacter kiritimatiensis]EOD00216.1 Phosphate regulon transcriptional regulatory protein PhoB (SphR) [Caldisalinibacter kiritimatiensis]
MKHIFVVDDEKNIRDLIQKYLQKEGYKVTLFEHGNNLISEINRLKPDLIVLDIMMPGIDGLELCKEIRKKSDIPIIFVSAKDEELDRILGLELGADDYLSKPFSPRELVVRIKNIFKRLEKSDSFKSEHINIKDIDIYCERRYVEKNGVEIKFTTKEYELLEFLVKNKNMPFTREQLLQRVWGYDYIGDQRVIDDLVKRIRKKLKKVDSELKITTVWGYGYRVDG